MSTTGKIPLLGFTAGAIKYLVLFGFSPNPAKEKLAGIAMTGSLTVIGMTGSGLSPLTGSAGLAPMTGSVGDN